MDAGLVDEFAIRLRYKGRRSALLWALAGAISLTGGCSAPPPPRPNVVIVVMDTVRRDRLACYGYERNTTPRLTQLARESTLYERAYSVSGWTSPAHASLFTGLYPDAHHCTQERWRLDADFVTLAEVLGGEGYRTLAIVENPLISIANGFDQGFQSFHEAWRIRPGPDPGKGDKTLDLLRASLAALPRNEPFFLFLNLIEAHNPYNSARQFIETFVSDRSIPLVRQVARDFYLGRRKYSDAEFRHLGELYDAEILYVDWFVGQLVDELTSRQLLDDTILVVTSDHGENIGDHGHVDHVFTLYETVTQVPLLIRHPRFFTPGAVDKEPAQLTDLFPTILNAVGLDSSGAQGVDLRLAGNRLGRQVLCEYNWPVQALMTFGEDRENPALLPWKRRLRSVIDGDHKLIFGSDGRHELYDLKQDPAEARNLAALPEHASEMRRLTALLEGLSDRYARGKPPARSPAVEQPDQPTQDALRSLGYIR